MMGTLYRAAGSKYPNIAQFPVPCTISMLTRGFLCFKQNGETAPGRPMFYKYGTYE
jgi:hypothetical protein